jgi:hypothetical protein
LPPPNWLEGALSNKSSEEKMSSHSPKKLSAAKSNFMRDTTNLLIFLSINFVKETYKFFSFSSNTIE